jgi:hypothetical protein
MSANDPDRAVFGPGPVISNDEIIALFDTDQILAGMEALADLGIMTKDSEAEEGYFVADADVPRYAPFKEAFLAALEREDNRDDEDGEDQS